MKSNSESRFSAVRRRGWRLFSLSALALATAATARPAHADRISDDVKAQISEILTVKSTFTPEEQKMSSSLVFARRKALGLPIGKAADALTPALGASTFVRAEIRGKIKNSVRKAAKTLGARLATVDKAGGVMTGQFTLDTLVTLAADDNVASVRLPRPLHTNVGRINTQGVIVHQAKPVYKVKGQDGTGVKVGVISDSASAAQVAFLKSIGELNASANVLVPYNDGKTPAGDFSTDEGAAIMEIVQDMAPGATVEFATGFPDNNQFAASIRALRDDGCKVIIDDLGGPEGVFQDDQVAIAVNDVTSTGTIYISSAGNSGSVAHGTSGCWEGDFVSDGMYTPPAGSASTKSYVIHAFAPGQDFNLFEVTGEPYQFLTWADSLNDSTNDYDLFVLDNTGATLKAFSVDTQSVAAPGFAAELTGSPDAVGPTGNYTDQEPGDLFVVTHVVGAADLAMHFDVERGVLSNGTGGATYGHNAGVNTVGVAASFWNSAHTGAKPFNGTNNPCETFSSDGPRKMFYNPDGTPISPGLPFTFAAGSASGVLLQKPDVTGADGVTCQTVNAVESFSPFFGTSAAAPHIAGIAAEIISARRTAGKSLLSPARIHAVLQSAGLDNEAAGVDPTGGYGTVNAPKAIANAIALP